MKNEIVNGEKNQQISYIYLGIDGDFNYNTK